MNTLDFIAFEQAAETAIITLRRQEVNLLNLRMLNELKSVLESLNGGQSLKAVVIKAAGRAFSTGLDYAEHGIDALEVLTLTYHRVIGLVYDLECPTLALVQGAAIGAGCEMACSCDLVLAAEGAKFGLPEIKFGLFPTVATANSLQFRNPKQMYELFLVGDSISAADAKLMGLANHVFPEMDFETKCREFLYRLTSNPGSALRLAKKAARGAAGKSFHEALSQCERIYVSEAMLTRESLERLASFQGKPEPDEEQA